jgi:mono/diheme cytochrome c family protein
VKRASRVLGVERRPLRWFAELTTLLAMTAIGCMSLEEMAPSVDDRLISQGRQQNVDSQALTRGREIYLNRCISCHNIEPVGRYTREQWEIIIPDMAGESNLDDQQEHDLLSYIVTAKAFTDEIRASPHPTPASKIPQSP